MSAKDQGSQQGGTAASKHACLTTYAKASKSGALVLSLSLTLQEAVATCQLFFIDIHVHLARHMGGLPVYVDLCLMKDKQQLLQGTLVSCYTHAVSYVLHCLKYLLSHLLIYILKSVGV